MKIRGQDGDHFNDGHDHRCPDCPQAVLHLPSEICRSCGRCDEHHSPGCPELSAQRGAKARKGDK